VTAESWTVAPTCRLDDAGDTDTDATAIWAGAVIVIAAEAVCPSLEAVTDTLPAATPVTSPELKTVAIPVLLEPHPIARPVSTLPLASSVTADSCTDAPVCRPALVGETDTDATGIGAGALTVRREEFVLPVAEALIMDWPGPTAFTVPVVSTVATLMLELSQVTVRPESVLPLESASIAVAFAVCPIRTADGSTATATVAIGVGGGGVTAILASPATPSLTALKTVLPGVTAEITPESLTLAMDVLELYQSTGRSVRAVPFASFGVAIARAVCPAASERGTVTATDATAIRVFPTSTTEVPYDPQATMTAQPVTARMKVRVDMRPPL